MKPEVEVKFLHVNHDDVREKLRAAGGVCEHPMRMFRRIAIGIPEAIAEKGHLRVRDEGNKVTMAYKEFHRQATAESTQEIEIEVSDFDKAVALLNVLGLPSQSFQESRRETWTLDGCEIVLDEWPWLDPYIEIEGESEKALKAVAATLGFDWNDGIFGSIMAAYRDQYPHLVYEQTVGELPEVKFGDPLPDMLKPAA